MAIAKYVLVTGCGLGSIGHALTKAFTARGYAVIATLLPHENQDHLQVPGVHCFVSDVTKDEDVRSLHAEVSKLSGGRLDILVNCAGIVDSDVDKIAKMLAVNVLGPMRMVHYFHRDLVAAKGTVVNIGSIAGVTPYCYQAGYNASKAALHHWGNTLRVELQPFGVRVVNVISGEVGTNILKKDAGSSLPSDSIYAPISDLFQAFCQRVPNTITPDQYAAGVVAEVTKKSPSAWFWFGSQTSIVRFCDALLPRTFWDWLFWRMFELGRLRKSA